MPLSYYYYYYYYYYWGKTPCICNHSIDFNHQPENGTNEMNNS